MQRTLLGLLLLAGCQKCTSTPAPVEPHAVAGKMVCTEAFLEVVPISLCDERCEAGDPEACGVASDRYCNGIGVRRDLQRGRERAKKGCELGSSAACAGAASAALNDDLDGGELIEFAEFQKQAVAKAETECAAGRARACESLSFWYGRPPQGGVADAEREVSNARRALELYRKGCDGGDWFHCRRLALATKLGSFGLEPDAAAAEALFKKACNLGDAHACANAFDGDGADAVAIPFLRRGCELGDGDACYGWAIRLSGDEKAAALRKSCDARFSLGCKDLKRALERAGDAEGAKKAQQGACELDERVECPK